MSRCGYYDDIDPWALIRWRGAVASSIRGKRGQALLRDILKALDAMPNKVLIAGKLEADDGSVCALGSAGKFRGMDMSNLDPEDYDAVAKAFGVAPALVREIEYINDERYGTTPEQRYQLVRNWVEHQLSDASQPEL